MYKYNKKDKNKKIEEKEKLLKNIWIDADNLTKDEEVELAEKLKIDLGILEDVRDIYEAPRFEIEDDFKTIHFLGRYPAEKKVENLVTLPFLISLNDDFILTVFHGETPFFIKGFRNENNDGYSTDEVVKFFISTIKAVNQRYQREFRKINKEVLQAKAHIRIISDKEIERFVELETIVNEYLNSLIPMEKEMESLLKNIPFQVEENEFDDFEDITLAQKQLIENAKNILKLIQNIRSAFEIIATNRLNRTVTQLTVVTVILTIPTMIAGLFGMNVPNFLEKSKYGFWFITIVSFILSYLFYWVFVRNKK